MGDVFDQMLKVFRGGRSQKIFPFYVMTECLGRAKYLCGESLSSMAQEQIVLNQGFEDIDFWKELRI